MRFIYINKQELKKDIQVHYKTVEEFLLTEFPPNKGGFQDGTQVALYSSEVEDSRFILIDETFEDDLKLELQDSDTLVVIVNPEGDVVQTIVGVAMVVVGVMTGQGWLIQAGVGVALGGISQMMMDKPEIPQQAQMKDTPKADEVFTTNLSTIKPKLGDMIPIGYGTFRKSPDLLSEYVEYKDNREQHHLVTLLGYGNYNINKAFLGEVNTDETNLNGTVYKQYNTTIPTTNQLLITQKIDDVLLNAGEVGITINYTNYTGDINVYYNFSGDINEIVDEINISSIDCNTYPCEQTLTISNAPSGGTVYVYGSVSDDNHQHYIRQLSFKQTDKAISYTKFYNQNLVTYIPKRVNYKDSLELNEIEMDWVLVDDKLIDYCSVNLIFPNGLYHQGDDGSLETLTRSFTIWVKTAGEPNPSGGYYADEIRLKTITVSTEDVPTATPKNTPIVLTVKIGNLEDKWVEAFIGQTHLIDDDSQHLNTMKNYMFNNVEKKRWIKVISNNPSNNTRDIDKLYLKTIYGMQKYTYNTSDKTFLTFNVITTNAIANSAYKNIIVEAERLDKQNDIKSVITDIFTNETYGGKLPQEMLNLPDTTETFNHCFTANQTVQEAIQKVAISGMYMLKPNQGIGLHKIKTQPLQFFLDASRIKDLTVESITKNEFMKDGYRVYYRDSDYKEQYVTYPANASHPNELHLVGCSSKQIASKYAYYLYQSEHKANIRYRFSVELEGNVIPLYSRIKIGFNHVNTGFSSTVSKLKVGSSSTFYIDNKAILKDVPDLEIGQTYGVELGKIGIIFHNDNLEPSETLLITNFGRDEDGYYIETYTMFPDFVKPNTPFHLGFIEKFVKDTVVKEKVWNGSGWDMMCELYNEELFQ